MIDRNTLRLCLVTDRGFLRGRTLQEVVMAAARGGATMIQLREKTAPTRTFVEEAAALVELLRPLHVPLLINDRVDVAIAVDAGGVHVGRDDMPIEHVRALVGPDKLVGLSITNHDDLRTLDVGQADYLGVGPVFAQSTKPDAAPPLGLDGLASIRAATTKPTIAIGGIDASNAPAVLRCGVDGVAVVSALMAADDPEAVARALAGPPRP